MGALATIDSPVARVTPRLEPITVAPWTDGGTWDAFVHQHPHASGAHLWAWGEVMRRAFGHTVVPLSAVRGGTLAGVLPLVRMESRLFGRLLVSMPFLNSGGVVADAPEVAAALLEAAIRLQVDTGARSLELRHEARQFPALAGKSHKVAMRLPLPGDEATLWSGLDRKVRNQVRKAERAGLTVESGGAALLPAFYGVFARHMRDLGTPVYDRAFFEAVASAFPDRTCVFVVRRAQQPVAASVTIRWRDAVEVPWASSLRSAAADAPNMLLYWSMLRDAVAGGARTFDFGRSTPDAGTFHFKRQWGATASPLWWEYAPADAAPPDHGPGNPAFRLAIAAWKRLPLAVATRLGPHIVRGIP